MAQTFQVESTRPHVNGERAADLALIEPTMRELDDMRSRVARFHEDDPSDILVAISAISGRLAEIRSQLYRLNTQRCTALRTREVDPLREELDLQFRVWSRRIALMEWELKMASGAV